MAKYQDGVRVICFNLRSLNGGLLVLSVFTGLYENRFSSTIYSRYGSATGPV